MQARAACVAGGRDCPVALDDPALLRLLPAVAIDEFSSRNALRRNADKAPTPGAEDRALLELGQDDEVCLFACERFDGEWRTAAGQPLRARIRAAEKIVSRPFAPTPTAHERALRFVALIKIAGDLIKSKKEPHVALAHYREAIGLGRGEELWPYLAQSRPQRQALHKRREEIVQGALPDNYWLDAYGDQKYFNDLLYTLRVLVEWNANIETKTGVVDAAFECDEKTVIDRLAAWVGNFYAGYGISGLHRSQQFKVDRILEDACKAAPAPAVAAPVPVKVGGRINEFHMNGVKAPTLRLDGLESPSVRLENSQFDTIEIRNAKLGSLKIKNVKYGLLIISGTHADSYDVDPSGEIVSTDSNYPQGGNP